MCYCFFFNAVSKYIIYLCWACFNNTQAGSFQVFIEFRMNHFSYFAWARCIAWTGWDTSNNLNIIIYYIDHYYLCCGPCVLALFLAIFLLCNLASSFCPNKIWNNDSMIWFLWPLDSYFWFWSWFAVFTTLLFLFFSSLTSSYYSS